jgi:hypothetical protein
MRYLRGLVYVAVCLPLGQPALADARTRPRLAATATDQPLVLDGLLEEPAWDQAEVAQDFVQYEPVEGAPATERTEVRVLYDANNLYFGVTCFQSEAGTVIVNQLARDFPITDTDVFGVALDTFYDRRNTFAFFTNPGGAQRDEQSFDDGRFLNLNWDGIWEVATTRGDDGWTAEIRIPFKTLRLGESTDAFGVNFYRNIRHKNEQVYWSAVPRPFTINRASRAGDLVSLQQIRPGTSLRLKPGFVARMERTGSGADRLKPEGSLDVKYGLSQALTLDLTVNPDFSQVEVDAEQINLTRFNLFFPEKRDFFLENEGVFHFGDIQGERGPNPQSEMRLFYSRRIGLSEKNQPISILGGVRLSGRAGPFTMGLLNMQQAEDKGVPGINFTVLRLRRHFLAASDVGAVYVGRESSGTSRDNRAYGVDANFRFHQHLTSNFYIAKTDTPGLDGEDTSRKAGIQWTDSFKMLQFIVTDTGVNFNPEVGFIERTGLRHYRANVELNPRPKPNRYVRGFVPHFVWRYSTDQTNRMMARDDHYGVFVDFNDGGRAEIGMNRLFEHLDEPFTIRPGIDIPVGGHHFNEMFYNYASDRSKPLAVNLSLRHGSFWNGDSSIVRAAVYVVNGPRLNASIVHNINHVDLPGGSFKADLTGLKVDYSFNPRMFLSGFLQYNRDTERWITNVRFRVIHRPLSDIFVVYTDDNPVGTPRPGAPEQFRAFLFKYTRAIEF